MEVLGAVFVSFDSLGKKKGRDSCRFSAASSWRGMHPLLSSANKISGKKGGREEKGKEIYLSG